MRNGYVKRRATAVGLAGLLLVVTGSLVWQARAAADPGTVARSKDGLVAMTLPADWQLTTLPGNEGQIQAKCSDKHAYVEVTVASKSDLTDPDLKSWAEGCRARSERTSKLLNRKDEPLQPVTVNGQAGYQYRVWGDLNQLRFVYVKTYVQTDRQLVEVMGWTTRSHEAEAKDDLDFMAGHVTDAPR